MPSYPHNFQVSALDAFTHIENHTTLPEYQDVLHMAAQDVLHALKSQANGTTCYALCASQDGIDYLANIARIYNIDCLESSAVLHTAETMPADVMEVNGFVNLTPYF